MPLEINTRQMDKAVVVDVCGEVDMHNSPEVRKVLQRLVQARQSLIVVNLSELAYIDSSGLATLVECLQGTIRNDTEFRLVGLNPRIESIFKLARLEKVFEICEGEKEALEGGCKTEEQE